MLLANLSARAALTRAMSTASASAVSSRPSFCRACGGRSSGFISGTALPFAALGLDRARGTWIRAAHVAPRVVAAIVALGIGGEFVVHRLRQAGRVVVLVGVVHLFAA